MALAAALAMGCASYQGDVRDQQRQEWAAREQQTDAFCLTPPDAAWAAWCNQREHEKDRELMRQMLQAQDEEHRAAERERRRQQTQDIIRASQAPWSK